EQRPPQPAGGTGDDGDVGRVPPGIRRHQWARFVVSTKCRALRTAKAITEPCGLTPGASGSSEESLTCTLLVPRTRPKLSVAAVRSSPSGAVEHRWTVITLARLALNVASMVARSARERTIGAPR